jgi:subtilisin family serine protease
VRILASFVASVVFCCACFSLSGQQSKQKIENSEQLPVHSYRVPGKASILVTDDAAFKAFSYLLKNDLENDLRDYDIEDKATLSHCYSSLMQIAVLDGRYDEALSFLERESALQDKPSAKAVAGLLEQPLIAAKKSAPEKERATFEAGFKRRLGALPYDLVQNDLKLIKAWQEVESVNFFVGMVEEQYDALVQKTGTIPRDAAEEIVRVRFTIRELLPYQEFLVSQLQTLIDAHKVAKPDMWAARTVTLGPSDNLTPVVMAIWDTGVDPSAFPGKMWVNKIEIPDNGKDDDANGYVDDVYGIAWTWYGKKTTGPLRTFNSEKDQLEIGRKYGKGFDDVAANLDTPEARAVKKKLASLPKDQVRPLIECAEMYSEYAHGTHTAGIAVAGNPAARILVVRMEWPYEMIPPPPNDEWLQGWVGMLRDSVRYMRDNGVRVVNMSWGITPQEIEDDMQASGAGGTVEQRHATAVSYFKMIKESLVESMREVPGILFVSSAGNSNSDERFDEDIPGSVDLPNTITVGAVDQAGDETSFTSFGKVDVYADGFEVDSVVPGGEHQSWSGTSEAAPQVSNLAAKLIARFPQLSTAQVKRLIVDGSDEKQLTGRTIRLINSRRSLQLAGSAANLN